MKNAAGQLRHIRWIGGSPCSGKSSIAEILCREHGWIYYQCDSAVKGHLEKCMPKMHPTMVKLRDMSWDEMWSRPVAKQVAEVLDFYREEFQMIVDDLLDMPCDRLIVAEGAALLPECVQPLLSGPEQAIWIVPTPEFQVEYYAKREWIHEILQQCQDPTRAFANWMRRDMDFARYVAGSARQRGYRVLLVDGGLSLHENLEIVREHFAAPSVEKDGDSCGQTEFCLHHYRYPGSKRRRNVP